MLTVNICKHFSKMVTLKVNNYIFAFLFESLKRKEVLYKASQAHSCYTLHPYLSYSFIYPSVI